MPIPTAANFQPDYMAPNVVGGKPVSGGDNWPFHWARTGIVAPGSEPVLNARVLAYDPTGDIDRTATGESGALKRRGVKAVDATFTDVDFAGFVIYQRTKLIDGVIANQTVVDDTQVAAHNPGDTLARAVDGYWFLEFDSAAPPADEGQVFVDNVNVDPTKLGIVSASVGVALLVEV